MRIDVFHPNVDMNQMQLPVKQQKIAQWTCPELPKHWWLQWLGILAHLMWQMMQNHGMA